MFEEKQLSFESNNTIIQQIQYAGKRNKYPT